jgi:hypothetical protein
MDVSVIIVNYNTKLLTKDCINSVFACTEGIEFEIIVVDNASTDGSYEELSKDERIIFVRSYVNLGFGKANNLGFQYAKGKYIFCLNSDTILRNNAIKLFYDKMESCDKKISCMGCLLQDANHQYIHSYADFPTLENLILDVFPYFSKLVGLKPMRMDPLSRRCPNSDFFQVDYITGADLFIRRNVIEELGLFDPAFFMYFEDPELQFRYSKAGYLSYIYDAPKIVHLEGKSTHETQGSLKRRISIESKKIYMKRTQPKWKYMVYNLLVSLCSKY